jgi:hypothetical protein
MTSRSIVAVCAEFSKDESAITAITGRRRVRHGTCQHVLPIAYDNHGLRGNLYVHDRHLLHDCH